MANMFGKYAGRSHFVTINLAVFAHYEYQVSKIIVPRKDTIDVLRDVLSTFVFYL